MGGTVKIVKMVKMVLECGWVEGCTPGEIVKIVNIVKIVKMAGACG